MISENLKKWLSLFDVLQKVKNRNLRERLLHNFSSDASLFDALREIIINIRDNNIDLKEDEKRKLIQHREVLRRLLKRSYKSPSVRKKIVNQSGGFLNILLPIVTSVITEIISRSTNHE